MYLKKLMEQREEKKKMMKGIIDNAAAENRAVTEEELRTFEELEKELKGINASIEAAEKVRDSKINTQEKRTDENETEEERAFVDYIRGTVSEERSDTNLDQGTNGAVIPNSIAQKIISRVNDISPIAQLATRYNVKGNLNIPLYDEETQSIQMSYANEFSELESTSGKFKSIELKGFLAGVLTKISKSLLNNSQFDLLSFVVQKMSESVAFWLEKELLLGTTGKIEGLSGVTQKVTAENATRITADELIDLQEEIPDDFQNSAIWIMSRSTRKAIRKLKDNDGNYILNKDATSKWGYTLFGKDVYTSKNMPDMEAGKTAIYYGDMSGLAVKVSEELEIQVLREKFATQHVVGVVGWMELDSKIENIQKISALVMGESDIEVLSEGVERGKKR